MTIDFNPSSTEFSSNPYAVYQQLRELDQPYFFEGAQALVLSRFADVEAAARSPKMVRSAESFTSAAELKQQQIAANWHDMPSHERFVQVNLLNSDGEVHERLRLIVMRHMSRRFVEQQRTMVEDYVEPLIAQLLEKKEIDFISDLACHVPGHIIGSVLGVPAQDCGQLRVWSENVVQFFDVDRTQEHKALAEQATHEFYEYLVKLIEDRERAPKSDLISALIQERDQGQLDTTELIATCMLILMAGHGSTIDVLGSGMHLLTHNPDQFEKLRNNNQLIPTAIQEMFRVESPLPFFHRFAAQEVEVMGKTYPVGTKFGLLYGSANRDPAQFTNPDMFDVERQPNRHVAFARGSHLCLGNHLSRIDMEVIFRSLIKHTKKIVLLEQPTFRPGLSSRGLENLHLELVAR